VFKNSSIDVAECFGGEIGREMFRLSRQDHFPPFSKIGHMIF
jgi:hypothetical protein